MILIDNGIFRVITFYIFCLNVFWDFFVFCCDWIFGVGIMRDEIERRRGIIVLFFFVVFDLVCRSLEDILILFEDIEDWVEVFLGLDFIGNLIL